MMTEAQNAINFQPRMGAWVLMVVGVVDIVAATLATLHRGYYTAVVLLIVALVVFWLASIAKARGSIRFFGYAAAETGVLQIAAAETGGYRAALLLAAAALLVWCIITVRRK